MNKVGIVISGRERAGGVAQYICSLIDALKKDQSNKYIIFCEKENDIIKNSSFEIRIIKKKNNFLDKIINLILYLFIIRSKIFFSKKDLILFTDIDYFIAPATSTFPHFFLGKPFIVTLHDLQEKYFPEHFTRFERFLRWVVNRALSKSASKILCESEFVKSDIIKFLKVESNKIAVIPAPPPEALLNYKINLSKKNIIKEKYNIKNKFIFYPAQTWIHKNHERLIDAFKIVSNQFIEIDLILTGAPKSNHSTVINKIINSNLSSRIMYLGYIDYSDLPYLYKLSEFVIMPSLFESISIPIYESFALKVPVLCSNVVGLPEQVGDSALTFNPFDIKDISNKMIIYLSNKNLREQMSHKGYERIKVLNHDLYCQKLLKILSSVEIFKNIQEELDKKIRD
jgi:glycosyltransferase involved in cell wall biosynthesis